MQKLEQEKHNLRQKLLLAESDGDVRVLELQADLKEFSQKLDVQEQNVRQAEREKTALIDELSQQNQRLTLQLQEANTLEVQLNVQLQEVRDQYSQRNTSLQVRKVVRQPLNYSPGPRDMTAVGQESLSPSPSSPGKLLAAVQIL